MVHLLGAVVGPENKLVQPADDNPRGFWEHHPIVELNIEILDRLGGTGMTPPLFPRGWETSPALDDLRQRAQTALSGFAEADMWTWKDPRTCLTLPFWQALLPPIRYVVCMRNPAAVAASLNKRNRIRFDRGVYLWLVYLSSALDNSKGEPRHFVFYDALVADPVTELRRLADFMGVPDRARDPETLEAASTFVDSGLRHHIATRNGSEATASQPSHGQMLEHALAAYDLMEKAGGFGQEAWSALNAALSSAQATSMQRRFRDSAHRASEWTAFQESAARDISEVTPVGATIALLDEGKCQALYQLPERFVLPFPDKAGKYWGRPSDSASAISELERLLAEGSVEFLVVARPAFWWLEHYATFAHYLDTNCRRLAANERVEVFQVLE
jgi:hypothetical protein